MDAHNNAYVTGTADTPSFSATPGAFQVNAPSDTPAFVTKFDPSGAVLKSTYLAGATGFANGTAIALNTAGEVYAAGFTSSSDFPGGAVLTPNPTAGYFSKFPADLSTLLYTTFLGADIEGIAVFDPLPFGVPQIYTAGSRFTGGLAASNLDAFVVKLDDDVNRWQILQQNPALLEMSAMMLDGNNGVSGTQALALPCTTSDACSPNWKFFGALDFNRDGFGDVVQYNATTGELRAWLRSSAGTGAVTGPQTLSKSCGPSDGCSQTLEPVGTGDFNHDGVGDLLWHNGNTGELQAWLLDGAGGVTGTLTVGNKCAVTDGCWARSQITGIGDFNHDGIDDLFWRDILTGRVSVVMLNGSGGVLATQILAQTCGPIGGCGLTWRAIGVADVNHDGFADLLWENPKTGDLQAWRLNGTNRLLGIQPISQPCPQCTQASPPVGILRDLHVTPQIL